MPTLQIKTAAELVDPELEGRRTESVAHPVAVSPLRSVDGDSVDPSGPRAATRGVMVWVGKRAEDERRDSVRTTLNSFPSEEDRRT